VSKYLFPLPGEGVTAEELAMAEILTALPSVRTYSGQARRDAMLAEIVAALYGNGGSPLIVAADFTLAARLLFSAAVAKILGGVTSLSLRNNADTQDNLLLTDAGVATIRGGLTVTAGGVTVLAGGASITGGIIGTLSTAAQGNVTSVGTLTALTVSAAPLFGVGSSVATAKPSQVLFQASGLSTTSTTDVSVTSFSLPANTLAVNGQALRVTVAGRSVSQNVIVHIKFGASDLANGTIGTGQSFYFQGMVARTGPATQLVVEINALVSAAGSQQTAETLSGAVPIDFRGSVTAGGTLNYDYVMVEYVAV
jgi:hypothetical protein